MPVVRGEKAFRTHDEVVPILGVTLDHELDGTILPLGCEASMGSDFVRAIEVLERVVMLGPARTERVRRDPCSRRQRLRSRSMPERSSDHVHPYPPR